MSQGRKNNSRTPGTPDRSSSISGSTFIDLSRRRFIQGLTSSGVLLGLSPWVKPIWAGEAAATVTGIAPVLTGTEFDLTVSSRPVNFTGAPRMATVVNGSLPAPTLRWREGDTITLRVTNQLPELTAIHWHGIILPYEMDGVPGHQLSRHRAGRDLCASLQGATVRHLLVPRAHVARTDRPVRRHHHRSRPS